MSEILEFNLKGTEGTIVEILKGIGRGLTLNQAIVEVAIQPNAIPTPIASKGSIVSGQSKPIIQAPKATKGNIGEHGFPKSWEVLTKKLLDLNTPFKLSTVCNTNKDNVKRKYIDWVKQSHDVDILVMDSTKPARSTNPYYVVPFHYERGIKHLASMPNPISKHVVKGAPMGIIRTNTVDPSAFEVPHAVPITDYNVVTTPDTSYSTV